MESIYPDTRTNIKEIFPERDIIFELKILLQLLRLEDEFILQKISKQGKEDNTSQDIPDKRRQGSCLFALI